MKIAESGERQAGIEEEVVKADKEREKREKR